MQNNKTLTTNMYSMQKYIILHNSTYKSTSFYIIRKGKLMKEQNRFVLVNGMGFMFVYRNLFMS